MDPAREFQLGDWQITPLRGIAHGPGGTQKITPKAMDVLLCLVRHNGAVVDRQTFLQEVWEGRAFSDEPLNKCIAELRRMLGDSGESRKYIETIPKRGYRLLTTATPLAEDVRLGKSARGTSRLRLAGSVIVLLLAAFGAWQLSQSLHNSADSIAIAVLPFANLDDAENTYFADGVHEELIGQLTQIEALSVRSRTSTLAFRDAQQSLPEIANVLNADVVVEGSVRRQGDSVRVTAQIIRANEDEHLWSGNIERSLSVEGLFAIQEQIASEIVTALRIAVAPGESAARARLPTNNMLAYDSFMLGKYHYRRKLPGDIEKSVQNFETTVELDPEFADAWDWLAYAYNHAATNLGYLPPETAYPKARSAALRALEIQPDLASAVSILGYIRAVYDRDWIGGEADLQRAIQLNPNDSGTVWSLAHVYSMLGRHDEAISLAREFAEQFPDDGRNHREVANRMIDAGRFDEALQQLDRAEQNDGEPAQIADTRGVALVGLGRLHDALTQFELSVEARQREPGTLGRLGYVRAKLGQEIEAQELLDELQAMPNNIRSSGSAMATIHTGLGNSDAALTLLEQLVNSRAREGLSIPTDPFLVALHSEPRFLALLDSLRLPPPL